VEDLSLSVFRYEWDDHKGIQFECVGEAWKEQGRWLILIGESTLTFVEEQSAIRVQRCWQARTVGVSWGIREGRRVVLRHRLKRGIYPAIPRGLWLPLRKEEVEVPLYSAMLALQTPPRQMLRGVTGIFSNSDMKREIVLPAERDYILLLSGLLEILPGYADLPPGTIVLVVTSHGTEGENVSVGYVVRRQHHPPFDLRGIPAIPASGKGLPKVPFWRGHGRPNRPNPHIFARVVETREDGVVVVEPPGKIVCPQCGRVFWEGDGYPYVDDVGYLCRCTPLYVYLYSAPELDQAPKNHEALS